MIAPWNELIRKKNGIFKDEIWVIHHPLDLRDKLQYKNIRESFFKHIHRHEYEILLSSSTTLIHYED